jgi:hypothetical protein
MGEGAKYWIWDLTYTKTRVTDWDNPLTLAWPPAKPTAHISYWFFSTHSLHLAMAPAPPEAAKLFHPKTKRKGPVGIYGMHPRSASPQKPQTPPNPSTPPTKSSPKPEPEVAAVSLPEGPYTDYTLVSSALNGWKYDVMKFDSRKPVDILRWAAPVKLNRKDLRRPDTSVSGPEAPKAVGPMLGPDGKPVIGMDGRIVMIDAEGKPIHGDGTPGGIKSKNGAVSKRKFQKKTKQVFKVPEATRQLRKEERYPWVMEDATGAEVWVGTMEEVSKASTQALFMPASNNTFKFVPAHRWYKFQKKPNYHIPNLEEAESLVGKYIFYIVLASIFAQDGHAAEEQGSGTMASTKTWRAGSLRSDLCLVERGVPREFCQRREFGSCR